MHYWRIGGGRETLETAEKYFHMYLSPYSAFGGDRETLETAEKCCHTYLSPHSAFSDNSPRSQTNGTNTLLFREAQHNALPCSTRDICMSTHTTKLGTSVFMKSFSDDTISNVAQFQVCFTPYKVRLCWQINFP